MAVKTSKDDKGMPVKDLRAVASGSRYPLGAFLFVQRGLDFTVRRLHGKLGDQGENPGGGGRENRHVSGRELCNGLRDYAIQEYGLMARTVLRRWRINASEDFGRIVFLMVEANLMYKTDDDRLEDFVGIYDFSNAFAPELTLEV